MGYRLYQKSARKVIHLTTYARALKWEYSRLFKINSDVLNINAAMVMPIKGSHSFFSNVFIVRLTYGEIVYTPFYLNEAKNRLNIQKIVSERKNRRYNDSVKKERGNL